MTATPKGEMVPVVGMGATKVSGSDRYPYFVIAVSKSGNKCTVQAAKARRTDSNGLGGDQAWDIQPNPNGATVELSKRKDGYFRPVGSPMENWNAFHIGNASRYNDPHF